VSDLFHAFILAVVQGLTEFLPISSSAHLILPARILGWTDQGLAFDVAVHVGTLSAVVFYYREDLLRMATAWGRSLATGSSNEDSKLVWWIGLATVPAGLVGLFAGGFIEQHLRTLPVLATTTIVFGILLGVADRRAGSSAACVSLTFKLALLIGLAQALAPVPGVSRSGITITAALLLGLNRQAAARYSFLLSIPIILSAGTLMLVKLLATDQSVDWIIMAFAALVAGFTAYLSIDMFLRFLDRVGLMPFVYYRIALGLGLFALWAL
jgi:undecaprenyl-diphosphatase